MDDRWLRGLVRRPFSVRLALAPRFVWHAYRRYRRINGPPFAAWKAWREARWPLRRHGPPEGPERP